MLEIDYGSSVFYYGDGVHQVRRLKPLEDTYVKSVSIWSLID